MMHAYPFLVISPTSLHTCRFVLPVYQTCSWDRSHKQPNQIVQAIRNSILNALYLPMPKASTHQPGATGGTDHKFRG